jgi:PAS domain S-box-containing protein
MASPRNQLDDGKGGETGTSSSGTSASGPRRNSFEELATAEAVAIGFWSDDGMVTGGNAGFLRLLGFEPGEFFFGKARIRDFTPEEYWNRDAHALQEARNFGTWTSFEKWVVRKDGRRLPVLFTGGRFPEGNGGYFVLTDLSRQKEFEKQLATQNAVTEVLARGGDFHAAVVKILGLICENHGGKIATLWLETADAGSLRCKALWPEEEEQYPKFASLSREISFRPGNGLPGRVLATGQYAFIPALQGDINFPRIQVAISEGLRSGFAFPIQLGKKTLGVVEFFGENVIQVTPAVVQLLTAVGNQLGFFIERTRSQEALRANEERLRWIVENTTEAIWTFELEQPMPVSLPVDEQIDYFFKHGFLAQCNQAMAEMYGFASPSEMVGIRLGSILVRSEPQNQEFLRAFVRSGYRLTDVESVDVDKQGRVKHTINNLVGLVERGYAIRAWGSTRDITERKMAETALKESESRLAAIISHSPAMIFLKDTEGRYKLVNKPFEQAVGKVAKEIIGHRDLELFGVSDAGRFHNDDKDVLQSKRPKTFEESYERGGRKFTVLTTKFPLLDLDGKPYAVCGIATDITERKESEQATREINEVLEHRVEERTASLRETTEQLESFCYTMAHDLRAPLRAMEGFAQILHEDFSTPLGPVGTDYTARIVAGAKRLDTLVQDLLSYARLSREELQFERINLDRLVRELQALFKTQPSGRGAVLEVTGAFPDIEGHLATVDLLLTNLISNALKFRHPERPIEVKIIGETRGGFVHIRVEDNGIGIAEEHLDRIFRVFERLHPSNQYPGTGIGLALVKKGVERMGGRVGVQSTPGVGSHFWIELKATSPDGTSVAPTR